MPISTEEDDRPKRSDREVLGLDDFTDADIAALEKSRPPIESAVFDDEVKTGALMAHYQIIAGTGSQYGPNK